MPDHDDATHRQAKFRADGDEIEVREPDEVDADEQMMEIRMPIASTGQVRNEGDDPLTREELSGMARQLEQRQIGVFPAHGNDSKISDSRYSPFERLGNWRAGEIDTRENSEDVLVATARMPDPESLPAATGAYREALAILKEQAKRGIGQDSSIGWRDDESFPGDVDLMEASIVGIGADWRTNTADEAAEVVAREAVAAGADPDDLVERVERAVRETPDDARPFGPPGDPNRWEEFDECVNEVEDWDGIDDPEEYCGWAKAETETEGQSATAEDTQAMSDDQPPDEPTEEQDASGGETEERDFEDRMLEMQQEQTDLLRELVDREDDMDGDDEDDEEDDEDEDGEMSADDPGSEQDTETSELEERLADLEAELEEARDGGLTEDDVETPDPEGEQDADTDDEETETRDNQSDADAATAGPNWRGD